MSDWILADGYRFAGIHAGIRPDPARLDLALVVSDRPAAAAGVFTRNRVRAAPVRVCQERLPRGDARGVVICSGNANACTGPKGLEDARQMTRVAAEVVGCREEQMLVCSTGVIGRHLPMDKVEPGIRLAGSKLAADRISAENAARAILTTDTRIKTASRTLPMPGGPIRLTGLAKGAAMIGPNMATMLSLVMTDAPLRKQDAQTALVDAMEESFHCISVDGHMSTNDTVLLLANGAAHQSPAPLTGKALEDFRTTLFEVCEDLAQSIPADGEGATHLITVEVHGCRNRPDALQIGKTIADSPLVKTAIAGADPNWGRIVSAAGYAGVQFDPSKVTLYLNGLLLYERGAPVDFDGDTVAKSIAADRDTSIVLILEEGKACARFWTTDLTAEYVRLNADYHT